MAHDLSVQRLLLVEDVDLVVESAMRRYDAFINASRASTESLIASR